MTDKTEAQPEALRLADERPYSIDDDLYAWSQSAEQVIRAQHAEIQQLKAQLSARQAAPDGCEPVWAVFRTRPDENDGKEFLHYAMWHNDTILSEGERYVQGHFVPGAAPPPPEREPLTELQITAALMAWFGHDLVNNDQMYRDKMRDAINAAHGIGATND